MSSIYIVVLMIMPFVLPEAGVMHCLCVAPTLVMSLMFIVLYLVDQVHDLAEQLYLAFQITFSLLALVVALLLNIIPYIVPPVDNILACLVSGPTLMLSTLIMILYIVDQVQYEAEQYYVLIELVITTLALIELIIMRKMQGAIYGLFFVDLLIAFSLDLYHMKKERGWTF